jgi:uncharacterized membrane protein
MIGVRSMNRNKSGRPLLKPEFGPVDWLLEGLALLGLLFFVGYFIYKYPGLPQSIPSHFNAAGEVDAYSSKSSVWLVAGIEILIYGLLTFMSFIPHTFNFLVKITAQNAYSQYLMAVRLIRYLKLIITLLFTYIFYSTVRAAGNSSEGLGLWFMPVFLFLLFIPIILYSVFSYKKK